ncbi:MAG: hypothetical protein MI810_17165 [Flavobacteriales bacterium]|jgi:hypothetical protein|nr:hypothetical protein [Flavobacteriales bacterium]
MAIWKEITAADLQYNKNDLDMRKMYRAGAIQDDQTYPALVVDYDEVEVKVLARLEIGFEEYIVFERDHYEQLPELV